MTQITSSDEQQWATEFAVTVDQIRDAVRAVGPNKADVEMYLKGSHASTDADVTKSADT